MPIATTDFNYVRTLVYDASGIVLNDKEYLVESRLSTLAQREGFSSLQNLFERLRDPAAVRALSIQVVDALTTNESLFFRDAHPFETLRKTVLPEIVARNSAQKRLRIWSAACSTGQEPYSIAMILRDSVPSIDLWTVEILGTDISERVLEQARSGTYGQLEVNRGLPANMLVKYFEQRGLEWRVTPEIRKSVKFEPLNLSRPWPVRPAFDIIMLRNVMIYFDAELRKAILARMAEQLTPAGYLFMGGGETPIGLSDRFEVVNVGRTAVYRLKS